MVRKIRFKNSKVFSVLSIILAILIVIGVASAIIFIRPKKTVQINSGDFVIGKITSNGEFMRSDDYICTNELIACDGLTVKPDYKTNNKFQIFFYDFNYRFVSCTDVLSDNYVFLDSVPFVEYCRIMILPDRDGKNADSFKITAFTKASYVNDFEITVDKDQVYNAYRDYFEVDVALKNKCGEPKWSTTSLTYVDKEGLGCSKEVDLTNVNSLYFVTDKVLIYPDDTLFLCFFFVKDKLRSHVSRGSYNLIDNTYVYRIDCSEYDSVIFHYLLDSECHLYLDKG